MATENGKVLAQKIDQYVELVSKLDEQIATIKKERDSFEEQLSACEITLNDVREELTKKDIVIDGYISKLHQIRALVEKI